jgi:hypothetical protein
MGGRLRGATGARQEEPARGEGGGAVFRPLRTGGRAILGTLNTVDPRRNGAPRTFGKGRRGNRHMSILWRGGVNSRG